MKEQIEIRWAGHQEPGQFKVRQPLAFGRHEDWPDTYPTMRDAIIAIEKNGSTGVDVVDETTGVIVWPSRHRFRRLTAGKDGRP